jgi:UDP-glucose 6-dehydrogenase
MAYGKHMDLDMFLCEATDKSNKAHLDFQLSNLLSENREAYEFHGITYKPETEIIEESQKLQLAIQLARRNKKVIIFESDSVIESLKFRFGDMFFYQRLKSKLE